MKRALSAFLFFLTLTAAFGAAYPTLYVVGAFQDWNLAKATVVNADSQGKYTFSITVTDDHGTFKMSFSGNSDWNQFDTRSIGIGTTERWTPGIYDIKSQVANSRLPDGTWVLTVYYDSNKIAMSAPGQPVPQPGDENEPGMKPSGTLPVLYINVTGADGRPDNGIIDYNLSHKDYFSGTYWLDTNGCEWMEAEGAKSVGSESEPLELQVKARGNYTRTGFSKKPFKIKLDKKQALLGLSKSKHFALMAHADDQYGFLRNFTGFNLGKRIGLPWTPSQQPVELVINGDYRGLYFLTESIRIEEDRVNIVEGKDNETVGELVSGGYIVELDNYDEDTDSQIRMNEKSCAEGHQLDKLRITFDTPEVYSDLQRRFITDQFSAMNDAIGANSDATWSYIDLDDAARYYLIKEIVSDTEAYHGSTYLFRDLGAGHKWHFSPLWDFGNAFNGSTSKYFYDDDPFGNTWIPSMRRNAAFNDKVSQTWLWFMSNNYDGIESDMRQYVDRITAAAALDNLRWTGNEIPQKSQSSSNIGQRCDRAIERLRNKTAWLVQKFGDYTRATFSEPSPDTTPAAELPDYAFTGVDEIAVDNDGDTKGDCVYYNLQGQRVVNPERGRLYITSRGIVRY